jgi:hypothetical protein
MHVTESGMSTRTMSVRSLNAPSSIAIVLAGIASVCPAGPSGCSGFDWLPIAPTGRCPPAAAAVRVRVSLYPADMAQVVPGAPSSVGVRRGVAEGAAGLVRRAHKEPQSMSVPHRRRCELDAGGLRKQGTSADGSFGGFGDGAMSKRQQALLLCETSVFGGCWMSPTLLDINCINIDLRIAKMTSRKEEER